MTIDPPRRTLARGTDSADPSFSVIAVLPDVVLCSGHAEEVAQHGLVLGWCDEEQCRAYGEAGDQSPCGQPYKQLKR